MPVKLFIVRWHLVVNVSDQRYPHLCSIITPQNIADEVGFDLHVYLMCVSSLRTIVSVQIRLYHLKRATQHSHQDVGEP